MELNLFVKIAVFILLGLFASWPYFEKYNDYAWLKRIGIGLSIILLLVLGTMDIISSDDQAKNDKKEINKSNATITTLSNKVAKLDTLLDNMKVNQQSKLDDMDKRADDRFIELNKRLTIKLQENKGDISNSVKDTARH